MALKLNEKLYEKKAVERACRAFKVPAPALKDGYYEIEIDARNAPEFANYVLSMMKAG